MGISVKFLCFQMDFVYVYQALLLEKCQIFWCSKWSYYGAKRLTKNGNGHSENSYGGCEIAWSVWVQKKNQGLQNDITDVLSKKKPANSRLIAAEVLEKTETSFRQSDFGRFFGKKVFWWSDVQRQFHISEENYDIIIQLGRSLTNFHIIQIPLRASDESSCISHHDRLYPKGVLQHKSNKELQKQYRKGKRRKRPERWESTFSNDLSSFYLERSIYFIRRGQNIVPF